MELLGPLEIGRLLTPLGGDQVLARAPKLDLYFDDSSHKGCILNLAVPGVEAMKTRLAREDAARDEGR